MTSTLTRRTLPRSLIRAWPQNKKRMTAVPTRKKLSEQRRRARLRSKTRAEKLRKGLFRKNNLPLSSKVISGNKHRRSQSKVQ